MKFKQVKALLIASALAAATIAAAGCGKKEEEQVSVSAEVEQAAAYSFKGSDLDGYITGLENRTVLKGASFSQWFEGVKADPDIVKEVIADVGDADANTAGTYDVEVKVIVDAAALDEAVEEREAEAEEAAGDTDGTSAEGTGDSSGAGAGDAAQGTDTATGAGDTADGTEQVFISDNLEDIMVEVTTDGMADAGTGEEAGGSLSVEEEKADTDYDPYEFTIDLSVEVVEEEQAAQIAAAGVYVDGYSTGERPAATTGVSGNSVAPSTSGNAATGNNTTAAGNAGGSASNGSTSSGNGAASSNNGSSSKPSGGSNTGSSGNSGSSGSSSSRPSGGFGSSGSSGGSSPSGNSGSSGGSSQPSKPAHEHTWVAQYKTVHHDAVKEPQWVQVTPDRKVYVCKTCHAEFEKEDDVGIHLITSPGCSSYSLETIPGDGYFKDVVIQEEYDEQVLTGYKCSGCGATK